MQVFNRLGIYEEISALGSYTNSLNITDGKLNIITNINLLNAEIEFKAKAYAIHRAKLHTILLNRLNGVKIHLNKNLESLSQTSNEVFFVFKDNSVCFKRS